MPTKAEKKAVGARLKAAREAVGFETATDAAEAVGISRDTYIQHESGLATLTIDKAKLFAKRFRTTPEYLLFGKGEVLGRIVGKVGGDADGSVIFSPQQDLHDYALLPPGASPSTVILEVEGHSLPGVAPNGSLIYYEERLPKPTPDMLNQLVICELDSGKVVAKRLRKGNSKDVFDLESIQGPLLEDQRLSWVAHVTWIAQPSHAAKIIRRRLAAA